MPIRVRVARALAIGALGALSAACDQAPAPVAPVLSPRKALKTFRLPEGYRIELVAAEPLVRDPVAIDFDADGRMYVVEMSGYMPKLDGDGEREPTGKIVVLEDTNDDGRMDRRTVFLDSLVLPRTVGVLEHGVLVGAPPYLWLVRDTTGDLRADVRSVVRSDFGAADANPEHNANGALWSIDNWIASAIDTAELRLRPDGSFDSRPTPSSGQWGVARDEYGRLYRNGNEDPLRADLVPSHYAAIGGARVAMRGVYTALTPNVAVWPAHKTPAINRGYRARTLRPDSTLAHYTAAGAPTPYLGDHFPAELRGSVFVTEPAGNLVGQFVVREDGGTPRATRARDSVEFLTSSDERFRPVNLASAPDGTLYIVDMYRGVIQHRTYVTDFLEERTRERGLDPQIGHGRIYRVVHIASGRGAAPRLSRATTAELVQTLTHANGWWRITAQRLLVERQARDAAPALRALMRHADDRVRLHALWTLDGVGEADSATVRAALADASPYVRAAAVRVAEPHIARGDTALRRAALARVHDPAPHVRRQLAATLLTLPVVEQRDAARTIFERGESDVVVADFAARALGTAALDALERVVAALRGDSARIAIEALAAAVGRARNGAAIHRALSHAGDAPVARALVAGLLRGIGVTATSVSVPARPRVLTTMGANRDSSAAVLAARLDAALHWPGKPRRAPGTGRDLTPAESARIEAGRAEFARICAACHQATGVGAPGVAAPLVGSPYVNGIPARVIRILLQGKEGALLMPPVGATMTDDQVAAVLSYVRRAWGHVADPIDAAAVRDVRGATGTRKRPWTDAELARLVH